MEQKNYQWPADSLSSNEMELLSQVRTIRKVPINRLIKEAVRDFCRQVIETNVKEA